jgi:hypothetical protein
MKSANWISATADDGRLREGRVDHAAGKLLGEPLSGAKDAASLDVLTHEEDAVVARHLLFEGGADGFDHGHLGHR